MMFSWPSPLPTALSGTIFGGFWPFPPDVSELEHATTRAAHAVRARRSRTAMDFMASPCLAGQLSRSCTALSGQAKVIGAPWSSPDGSDVLALSTVAISVTPGVATAAILVVGPA